MVPGDLHLPALYLIRHGEPSITGVLLGHKDPPLSESGRLQMRSLHVSADVYYTSPLCRARESADLCGTPIVVLPELAEITLGEWDGRSWSEIETAYPSIARQKAADWTGVTPPGGETWEHFTERVDHALDVIRRGPLPAAVVAHVGVNAWIAHRIAGVDPLTFQQEYGQIHEYEL